MKLGDFLANATLADLLEEHDVEPQMARGFREAARFAAIPQEYPSGVGWSGSTPYDDDEELLLTYIGQVPNDHPSRRPYDRANAYRRLGTGAELFDGRASNG